MESKIYIINKNINTSIEFKGLNAQYIGWAGLPLTTVVSRTTKKKIIWSQYFIQPDCAFCYSRYMPDNEFLIAAEQNIPGCELRVCLLDHIISGWDGSRQLTQVLFQLNLSYGLLADNIAHFDGISSATLDFHLSRSLLRAEYEPYPNLH